MKNTTSVPLDNLDYLAILDITIGSPVKLDCVSELSDIYGTAMFTQEL